MALPIVHSPDFHAELPGGHRFPMGKFRRLAQVLMEEGLAAPGTFHVPVPAPAEWIAAVHEPGYVRQVFAAAVDPRISREIGLPVTDQVSLRARSACAGSVLAGQLALQHGIACNTAGGSHHARRAQGAGFCVFNDVAVAIRQLQACGEIERALVIDLDVHQGDGTAEIFAGDDSVFTFSMHAEKNYPVRKHPSSRDIALPDATQDAGYMEILRLALPVIIEAAAPDIVFFNAGVDPHADDRLGRLALSDEGLTERDRTVIGAVRERGIALAGVLGGGYSNDVDLLARRHATLHRVAAEFV
ncbi:histone deacetylase [Breoghania sp. L-A4]|uniref:histone deacetylase family protein n=1 Tax=Breoghania sp. L-A4 TaxID=2304600 RepID=UPI000E35E8FA|nr:histone deacetylase [Breoghania sp. L-A4]AXS39642.1 histone deacetylase [Breoghania sp. L-A4]